MWPIRSLDCVKPCSALGYGIEQRRSWTSSPSSLAPFISLSPPDCVPWFIVWWTHSIKSKTFFWTYGIIWLKSQRSSKLLVQEIPKVVGSCPCLGSIFTTCSNFFDTPLNIFNFWWQSLKWMTLYRLLLVNYHSIPPITMVYFYNCYSFLRYFIHKILLKIERFCL